MPFASISNLTSICGTPLGAGGTSVRLKLPRETLSAESYIYTTEKLISQDLKDKITQEKGIKITDAIRELKEVLNKDSSQIKPKLDALKSIVNEVTTELYKNVTPPPGAEQQSGGQQQSGQEQKTTEGTESASASEQENSKNSGSSSN